MLLLGVCDTGLPLPNDNVLSTNCDFWVLVHSGKKIHYSHYILYVQTVLSFPSWLSSWRICDLEGKGLVNIRFQSTHRTAVLTSAARSDLLVLALFSPPLVKGTRSHVLS